VASAALPARAVKRRAELLALRVLRVQQAPRATP
jgi:hypothetical protein